MEFSGGSFVPARYTSPLLFNDWLVLGTARDGFRVAEAAAGIAKIVAAHEKRHHGVLSRSPKRTTKESNSFSFYKRLEVRPLTQEGYEQNSFFTSPKP